MKRFAEVERAFASGRESGIARDHPIDLDGLAVARVGVHDEHRRRAAEPSAELTLADVLGRAQRAVSLDHPDWLALVEEAAADLVHGMGV